MATLKEIREKYKNRNYYLYKDRAKGLTYRQLGEKYGVSGSRAAQIVERAKRIEEFNNRKRERENGHSRRDYK